MQPKGRGFEDPSVEMRLFHSSIKMRTSQHVMAICEFNGSLIACSRDGVVRYKVGLVAEGSRVRRSGSCNAMYVPVRVGMYVG